MADLRRGKIHGVQVMANNNLKYLVDEYGKRVWLSEAKVHPNSIEAYQLRLLSQRPFWINQIIENKEQNERSSSSSDEDETDENRKAVGRLVVLDESSSDEEIVKPSPIIVSKKRPHHKETNVIEPKRSRPSDIFNWARNLSGSLFEKFQGSKQPSESSSSTDSLPIQIVDRESDD